MNVNSAPLTEWTDAVLVEGVVAGKTELFAELIRRNNPRMFRIARSILGCDADAEDALQESYLIAYRKLSQVRELQSVSAWLGRIVAREAWARRAQRESNRLRASPDPDGDPSLTDEHEPGEALVRGETRALLEAAIDTLPANLRTAFVLRQVEGMSTREVAELLGVGEDLVRMRLHRARQRLRALLERAFEDPGEAYLFLGERCARLTARVLARLRESG